MHTLRKLWIQLRSSLWFVPSVLVSLGAALALILVQIDVIYAAELSGHQWSPLLNTGAEGARGMLTAIAGSMITVAGVAFSVTIVSLSLASSQFTPRILRNFMRDRGNQFVLGTFVAIYVYCLITLRAVRASTEAWGSFVPLLAIAFALVLALFSVGCLIYFIHHTATSIQASTILKAIGDETEGVIDQLYPDQLDGADAAEPAAEAAGDEWSPVAALRSGYVQHGDGPAFVRFAKKHDLQLRIVHATGDFVAEGAPLLYASRPIEKELQRDLGGLFVLGAFRTIDQDVAFGVRQIVDIALKALSPSVNDTNTAVSCLDYLGVLLGKLATRKLTSPLLTPDSAGRVFAKGDRFADFVAKALDEVRLAADGNVSVILRLLTMLRHVANLTDDRSRQRCLADHATIILADADRTVFTPYDRQRVNVEVERLRETLSVACDLPALSASHPAPAPIG